MLSRSLALSSARVFSLAHSLTLLLSINQLPLSLPLSHFLYPSLTHNDTNSYTLSENREAVHEVQGVRRLLYYIGDEMANILSDALAGGADIPNQWTGIEHALAAINNACCSV